MSAALRLAQLQKERAASRWRLRCSRRRAKPARTCCPARCSIRRRSRTWFPTSRRRGAPLALRGPPRHIYFLTRSSKVRVSDHAAAASESRQLHHFAQPVREMAGRSGRGGRHRRLHRVSPRRRSSTTAIAWPASAPAIAASASTARGRRRSSQASTSARRSRSSADGVRGNLTKALVRRLALDDGRTAAGLCARDQGAVGGAEGPRRRPARVIHTMGYPLRHRGVRRRRSSTRCPTASSRSGSSPGSTIAIRCSIRTSRSSTSSAIRCVASLLNGGQMIRYGAKALPGRGLAHDSQDLCGRRADRRRRGGIHEFDAAEGHPPGDAHRHAGGGNRVRAVRKGDTSAAALQALRGRDRRPATSGASCIRSATSIRASATDLLAGAGVFRAVARHRRLVVPGPDAGARWLRADRRRWPTTIVTGGPIRIPRSTRRRSIAS